MHAAQPPVLRHSTHWKSRRYLPNVLFLRHPEPPPRPQRRRLPRFVRMACAPCLQWWRRKLGPALRLAALGANHVPPAHRCFRRVRAFEDVHVACCVLFDGQLPAAQFRALPICSAAHARNAVDRSADGTTPDPVNGCLRMPLGSRQQPSRHPGRIAWTRPLRQELPRLTRTGVDMSQLQHK